MGANLPDTQPAPRGCSPRATQRPGRGKPAPEYEAGRVEEDAARPERFPAR
jgi:hypothetical protein